MHTDHNLRVVARTAELTAEDDDTDTDDDAWRFGGVAVGEGDILYTDDGKPVVFTADVLADAAHTQAGEPLSKNHPEDDEGNPVYPPPVEETAGTVEKAGYVPGKGLVYEARTHDETIAEGVKAGSFDVSVHPTFDLGEKDPETGAYIPENVEFLDLATVSKGMSASNTAEWGPNQALASWTKAADIGAEIDAHTDTSEDREGLIASTVRATLRGLGISQTDLEITAQEVGDAVRWESDAGGENEPSDVRYGVVIDGLQDDAEDMVLVAVYEPSEDGDGWENRGEENPMSRETLEVVGSDGVESLPPVSQVTASADASTDSTTGAATESDSDSSADTDATENMGDPNDTDETDEQTGEETAEETGSSEETETTTETESNTVEVDLGEHDSLEDLIDTRVQQATASSTREDKVEEVIANSEEYDDEDREELMAASESLFEKIHSQATRATGARLPGSASARSSVTAGASTDDEEDLDAYGTGLQE